MYQYHNDKFEFTGFMYNQLEHNHLECINVQRINM